MCIFCEIDCEHRCRWVMHLLHQSFYQCRFWLYPFEESVSCWWRIINRHMTSNENMTAQHLLTEHAITRVHMYKYDRFATLRNGKIDIRTSLLGVHLEYTLWCICISTTVSPNSAWHNSHIQHIYNSWCAWNKQIENDLTYKSSECVILHSAMAVNQKSSMDNIFAFKCSVMADSFVLKGHFCFSARCHWFWHKWYRYEISIWNNIITTI